MTCIVGILHDDAIYVGGDSAAIDVETLATSIRMDEKVFLTEGGDFVMGFAGSWRMGQLVRYALDVPEHPRAKDDMTYLVNDFADALKKMLSEKGSLTKDNGVVMFDGELVLGYRGNLYVIDSDLHVSRSADDFVASGMGAPIALGALYATKHSRMGPEKRIALALGAAARYNASVKPPFHVLKLG